MRVAIMLAFALLLGACNRVYTTEPLFAVDKSDGSPRLRDGVWRTNGSLAVTPQDMMMASGMRAEREDAEATECPVDEKKPAKSWWPCGQWLALGSGKIRIWRVEITDADADRLQRGELSVPTKGHWSSYGYVLAEGEPMVLQLAVPMDEMTLSPQTRQQGHPQIFYGYFGAVATRRGADGRIEALETWPVLCGPPPPPKPVSEMIEHEDSEESSGSKPSGTLSPFAGIEMTDDESCTTGSAEVLRNAAVASRAFADGTGTMRWVEGAKP